MSQTPQGSAPSASSPHTALGAAQAVLSYLGQGSTPEPPKPTAVLDAASHDVHGVMSRIDQASESSTSAVTGAAQNLMSRIDKASESSTSAVTGAAQNVMSRIDKASDSSTSAVMGVAQSLFSRLEKPSEVPTSSGVMGAAQSVLSRMSAPSAPQASSTLAFYPLPELPQEHSGEALTPGDAPQQRAAEPGAQVPTSVSSHGAAGGREITPPRAASRRDSRLHRSYPALPEAAHQRPIPVPYGTAYRRSTGPYPDGDAAWYAGEEKDPLRPRTVGERLEETITSADAERIQATDRAKTTGLMLNIALGLQILIGALTTALGAALGGKKTSVAISILGGASTLVASYLARTKGTNEPAVSSHRAQQLEHFIREIKAFKLDHGHETGDKWDHRIHGFRLGLEKILGNQPGSVAVTPDGAFNPNQEKGVGDMGLNTGLGANGSYGGSTLKAKAGAFDTMV